MAAVFALLMMFVMFAFFGGLIYGIVHLAKRAREKQQAAWLAVAQHYGLNYAGNEINGMVHGQPMRVCTVVRGSGKNKTTYTVVSARFNTPLDLGLSLRHHGFFNDMFHKSLDVVLGDASFDNQFIVSGDEPHRVFALLGPRLRALIMQWLVHRNEFSLTDNGVSTECVGLTSDTHWLMSSVEGCAQIAAGMHMARSSVPVASALAHHREAWAAFATASGLTGLDTPLCMWGELEGVQVYAYAVRIEAHRYELEVAVCFADPLGAGLEVMPTGLLDKVAVFFGGQDHRFGDPMFDDTFRVKVSIPERAEELLDARIRHELLVLHTQVGPVTLNDRQLTVRLKSIPHHPAIVPRTVRQMLSATEMLGTKALTAGSAAYR